MHAETPRLANKTIVFAEHEVFRPSWTRQQATFLSTRKSPEN